MTKQAHPISWFLGSSLTAAALAIGVIGVSLTLTGTGYADDGRGLSRAIPQNAEYTAERGSCHMAYPANLPPPTSGAPLPQILRITLVTTPA